MRSVIPRFILWLAAGTLVVSIAVSAYLEIFALGFLQAHPVMVNLVSGVIGFCAGLLTLYGGFEWLTERKWISERVLALEDAAQRLNRAELAVVLDFLPDPESPLTEQQIEAYQRDLKPAILAFGLETDPLIAQAMTGIERRIAGEGFDVTEWFGDSFFKAGGHTKVIWRVGPLTLHGYVRQHPRVRRYFRMRPKLAREWRRAFDDAALRRRITRYIDGSTIFDDP